MPLLSVTAFARGMAARSDAVNVRGCFTEPVTLTDGSACRATATDDKISIKTTVRRAILRMSASLVLRPGGRKNFAPAERPGTRQTRPGEAPRAERLIRTILRSDGAGLTKVPITPAFG